MASGKAVSTTAGDLVRQFSHFSDVALPQAVVVTKNGRPRNVIISVEEYERLKSGDQQTFLPADTPERLLADLKKTARRAKC